MFFVGSLTVPLAYATHYEILNVRCSGRLTVRGDRHCDAKYTKKPKSAEQAQYIRNYKYINAARIFPQPFVDILYKYILIYY